MSGERVPYLKMLVATTSALAIGLVVDEFCGGIPAALVWLSVIVLCFPLTYLTIRTSPILLSEGGPLIDPNWYAAFLCYGFILPVSLMFYLVYHYKGWIQSAALCAIYPTLALVAFCDKLEQDKGDGEKESGE